MISGVAGEAARRPARTILLVLLLRRVNHESETPERSLVLYTTAQLKCPRRFYDGSGIFPGYGELNRTSVVLQPEKPFGYAARHGACCGRGEDEHFYLRGASTKRSLNAVGVAGSRKVPDE